MSDILEQAEKITGDLHLPLSWDENEQQIVTQEIETEYGEYGAELYKYQVPLDCNLKRDADRVIEAINSIPGLVAECKRLEEVLAGTTRGIEDARYECRRAITEAARWQAAFQPGDERCLKAVIGLVRGVLGPETVSDELSCLLRLQKAAAPGCQPRVWAMTEERKAAIVRAHDELEYFSLSDAYRDSTEIDAVVNVLEAMLVEAKQ